MILLVRVVKVVKILGLIFFNLHVQVITCEGNAGFYEVGLMTTPLKGLSLVVHVLSWPILYINMLRVI